MLRVLGLEENCDECEVCVFLRAGDGWGDTL